MDTLFSPFVGVCFRFILAMSLLAMLILRLKSAKSAIRGADKLSRKKIRRPKKYRPEVSFYREGEMLHASMLQHRRIIVGLISGYIGIAVMAAVMFFLEVKMHLLLCLPILLICSSLLLVFISFAFSGTLYLIQTKESLIMDSSGIRGVVRDIPRNFWKRLCGITPLHAFDYRWNEITATTIEMMYVGIWEGYVVSFYGDDSDTEPLVRINFGWFGEPRQLVDVINHYYAIGNNDSEEEYILIRPLPYNIVEI